MVARGEVYAKISTSLVLAIVFLLPLRASGGIDSPGWMLFDFLADQERVIEDFDQIPEEAILAEAEAQAYFNSRASGFEWGLFIWAGFELDGPDGPRQAVILLDLDLDRAPVDGVNPVPHQALRAEYFEKRGDEILFHGTAHTGDVWLVDIYYHEGDQGAVDGDFALIFSDGEPGFPGSRLLVRGRFATEISPQSHRTDVEEPEPVEEDYEDYEGSGCSESESEAAAGCAEVGGEIFAAGCAGAIGSLDCEGDTYEEASLTGRRAHPLMALTRILPQVGVVVFIGWMKRRRRKTLGGGNRTRP